jgi:hypothetical protein
MYLSQLKNQRAARPFLKPVDKEEEECPDYDEIVKCPMDL